MWQGVTCTVITSRKIKAATSLDAPAMYVINRTPRTPRAHWFQQVESEQGHNIQKHLWSGFGDLSGSDSWPSAGCRFLLRTRPDRPSQPALWLHVDTWLSSGFRNVGGSDNAPFWRFGYNLGTLCLLVSLSTWPGWIPLGQLWQRYSQDGTASTSLGPPCGRQPHLPLAARWTLNNFHYVKPLDLGCDADITPLLTASSSTKVVSFS